ncbi:MAG: hypothetical protein AB8B67_00700 [Rickettsiaceae bacterium]
MTKTQYCKNKIMTEIIREFSELLPTNKNNVDAATKVSYIHHACNNPTLDNVTKQMQNLCLRYNIKSVKEKQKLVDHLTDIILDVIEDSDSSFIASLETNNSSLQHQSTIKSLGTICEEFEDCVY